MPNKVAYELRTLDGRTIAEADDAGGARLAAETCIEEGQADELDLVQLKDVTGEGDPMPVWQADCIGRYFKVAGGGVGYHGLAKAGL